MLDPKRNRIDYGEQLSPPEGYNLIKAIGTTYSLDLEALMMIPVSLFYSQKIESNHDELRYDVLDAITKASKKITIFYQRGKLKVPRKYNSLMSYLEDAIHEVKMPNHISSFHPKIWIAKYARKSMPDIFRVLITSRNMTFSHDWDVAISTDGFVTEKDQFEVRPLINFLQFLNYENKNKIDTSFLNDLSKVSFDLPDGFEKLDFKPIGIKDPDKNKKYFNILADINYKCDDMLIISPFLDIKTLKLLREKVKGSCYLLSRKAEMDSIPEGVLYNFKCWQFSKMIQDAERSQELSEGDDLVLGQDLHAKLFIFTKDGISYWYLGSANCSDPAQERNIEFMMYLKGKDTKEVRLENVLKILTKKDKNEDIPIFEPYEFDSRQDLKEQKLIDRDIRKIIYDLSCLKLKGSVDLIEGGTDYNILITIDARRFNLKDDYTIWLKPLPEKKKKPVLLKPEILNKISDFKNYSKTELSPFLEFEIRNNDEVLRRLLMPMEIKLPEDRLDSIFRSVINSKDKFFKYLNFLLTGNDASIIEDRISPDMLQTRNTINGLWTIEGTQIFEKLLIASSRYPEKLKSIDRLIKSLKYENNKNGETIISEDFEKFWKTFEPYFKNQKQNGTKN
jgi:hypothetical protein